ncbi:hypothetical protein [Methylobacterium sp. Leaf100]|uniref:hypothetical protein n=1 Tax=Methylobacterium sp. Leaf100 TaxID=1736252 RepID=UPI0006F89086|nr:hypothetical protein [Methylobacterium sp. Leaf100]KQP36697.1 hypothetical protein ASF25_01710 [Methylobacterium sp. Leaf100]
MYLILVLMACTPGGKQVPCTFDRVREPVTPLECARYVDGRLLDGRKMFICATDDDLKDLKRTKGMAATLDKTTAIAVRLTSQIR